MKKFGMISVTFYAIVALFIALALINLSCQLLINQLEINDGHSLLNKARE